MMSPLLQLKLTNLNPTVLKCGFPVNSLEKYMPLLEQTGKTIEIIDLEKNISSSPQKFVITKDVKDFIIYLSSQNTNNFSIKEAYEFIDEIVLKSKNLLKEGLDE